MTTRKTQRQLTAYFRRADGAIVSRTLMDAEGINVSMPPPVGAMLIDEAEALAEIRTHQDERAQRIARDLAERHARRQAAHDKLLALGLDADTAAFLTGAGPS